jgi:hypothetical protein
VITAQTVGAVLGQLKVGKANATPGHVIARRLGLTRLRSVGEAIAFERARRFHSGEPQIAGDASGYWIIEDASELERPRKTLRARALSTLLTAKYLDPELYRRAEAQGILAFLRDGGAGDLSGGTA